MIKELYDQFIKPVLGPLVTNSSDGDSRRRKLFLQSMSKVGENRFQAISRELGFVLTAKKIIENADDPVGYSLSELCDPDFIHNHKKLVNLLDSDARVLQMGSSIPYRAKLCWAKFSWGEIIRRAKFWSLSEKFVTFAR